MMERVSRWLTGWAEVEVRGDVPRFLNAAARSGLEFWSFRREGERAFVRARPGDCKRLRPLARRCRVRLRLGRRAGLPFRLARLRRRPGLPLGLLGGAAVFWFLSGFCWGVSVTGAQTLTQAQVLGAAREGGVFVGASLRGFDANAAGLAVQNSLETVAWLAVNEDGCFLEVALHEAAPVPAVEGGREWSNLVASRAGTVVSIQAQRGRQEVAVGDTVTPGQLLIAGLYTVESVHPYGPQPDTPQQTLGPARGSVRALTYREFTVEVSRRQTVLVPRGEPLRQRAVTLFGLRLPLGFYPKTEGEARSWRRTTAWAPLGRSLPLLWEEAFVQPLEEETVYLTEEELRLAALRALRQKQREELPPGSTVAEETLTYQLEEGRCVLRAQCRCEEEIGIVRKISFE